MIYDINTSTIYIQNYGIYIIYHICMCMLYYICIYILYYMCIYCIYIDYIIFGCICMYIYIVVSGKTKQGTFSSRCAFVLKRQLQHGTRHGSERGVQSRGPADPLEPGWGGSSPKRQERKKTKEKKIIHLSLCQLNFADVFHIFWGVLFSATMMCISL